MNTNIIKTQLKIMEAQAAILSEATEADPKTSVYFEGKKAGFEMLQDKGEIQVIFARDHAQAEAIRHRTELNDLLKYQYFEGIAAAANEVIGLFLMDCQQV